jgi:hypothetical protein
MENTVESIMENNTINSNITTTVANNTPILNTIFSNNKFGININDSNAFSSYKKSDNSAEFKYICIKKEYFDVNMIYLNYTNIKKQNYIEIIYKSPSIFLEGLFFKTPHISASQIRLVYKDKHNYNYITVKITLDNSIEQQAEFIKMLHKSDEYINNYILRFAKDINKEFFKDELNNSMNTIEMFRYDNILKHRGGNNWELNMKSYLDKPSLDMLSASKFNNIKYIFTFNITNIYLGNVNLIPLIKCNKCETIS